MGAGFAYAVQTSLCKPADAATDVRRQANADWDSAEKNQEGRVEKEAFKAAMKKKFATDIGGKVGGKAQEAFDEHLDRCFAAGIGLMLPKEKTSLGRHCFGYAAIMAGEFYFSEARDAEEGCGCNADVKDVLGLKKVA